MNRENLEKLATYLEGLPKDYQDFDMGDFFEGVDDFIDINTKTYYALHNGGVGACGAVACAVGHGPSAGIYFNESQIGEYGPNWTKYTEDNLCKVMGGLRGINSPEFEWMFGGSWSEYDNTPQGAAARIRYLLDGHPVPLSDDHYTGVLRDKSIYKEYLK